MLLIDVIKAILVRLVLGVHSLLAVWRVVVIANDNFYWWLGLVDVGLIVEGFITLITRKGSEYKWFCPCFLIYLGGTVPAIWILELDRRDRFIRNHQPQRLVFANITTEIPTTTAQDNENSLAVGGLQVSVPINLGADKWVEILEQLLLYFMILGRWLLPRGNISRNELSQLLFVFIGMASDITELFTLFDEEPIRMNIVLTYVILLLWTLSLLQFCFVLTATKNPNRTRVALNDEEADKSTCKTKCCSTEMWSIFVSMCMQDLPFLLLRAYSIATFHLITYSIIFFTAKNVLIVLLLLYRIVVICLHKTDEDEDDNSNQQERNKHRQVPQNNTDQNHISQNNSLQNRHSQILPRQTQQQPRHGYQTPPSKSESYQNYRNLRHQNNENHSKEIQYYRNSSKQTLPNVSVINENCQLEPFVAQQRVHRWIKDNNNLSHMNGNARKYTRSNGIFGGTNRTKSTVSNVSIKLPYYSK